MLRGSLEEVRGRWLETIEGNPGDLIAKIQSTKFDQEMPYSKYFLKSRELCVNELHPYFVANSETLEGRKLLQEFALANFLTELYLISHDVDSVTLDEGRLFRDEFLRLLAQLGRKTGSQIAQLLVQSSSNEKDLERTVGEALDYIGFNVRPMAGNGEPDGTARAPLTPRNNNSHTGTYLFTYDAKSTGQNNGRVSNEHVRAGTLARHRQESGADYTLVVAPNFQLGALQRECEVNRVTPIRTEDLARLLILSAASGNVDFESFQTIFALYDPDCVHSWVEDFIFQSKTVQHISVMDLLAAFEDIGIDRPDELATDVVSFHLQQKWGTHDFPNKVHIRRAVEGLGVFLPSIVRINNNRIYLSALPRDIRLALIKQLNQLPNSIMKEFKPDFEERTAFGLT